MLILKSEVLSLYREICFYKFVQSLNVSMYLNSNSTAIQKMKQFYENAKESVNEMI